MNGIRPKAYFKKINKTFVGHSNISNDNDLAKMIKRQEFTRLAGEKYINISAGHKRTKKIFIEI